MTSPAPPVTAVFERQKESLLRYIADNGLLPPGTNFRYMSHELESRRDEPMMVRVDITIYEGSLEREASLEIPLESLKLSRQQSLAAPVGTFRDTATATPQRTWDGQRNQMLLSPSVLEGECRRHVTCSMEDGVRRISCGCINGRRHVFCSHLQFVFATGWDREKLFTDGPGLLRRVKLPIGMGLAYINLEAELMTDDSRPFGEKLTGYVMLYDDEQARSKVLLQLAKKASPYPDETSKIILGPGEGGIKAIRYIEGLLRTTETYQKLSKVLDLDRQNPFQLANLICSRVHRDESGRKLVSQFIAGLRAGNVDRDNWMLACAYTVTAFGLCLPCNNATSSSANIPQVPT